jgi:hypothetical protein
LPLCSPSIANNWPIKSTSLHPKIDYRDIMTAAAKRTILRWIHIVFSIPIIGYVYSPLENIPEYATPTRFVFLPILVVTGLWMWKGTAIVRLFSKLIGSGVATN